MSSEVETRADNVPDATLTFRDATADDLPAIVALLAEDADGRAREIASEPVATCYTQAFTAIVADPNQHQVVAVEDERVVGTMQLTVIPGLAFRGLTRCVVEAVRIAGDRRGNGLGTAMMRHAIELAEARGCRLVQLTSKMWRTDAHRFYERLGFEKSHYGFKLYLDERA